jgi:protein SCO1/2
MTGWLRHPLFAPVLTLVALGWGTAVVVFLVAGPNLGGWATAVLTWCFGWDATTRAYRLDTVLLVTLQPPLFTLVLGTFYADEIRTFLGRTGGRVAGAVAVAAFVGASATLVLTGQVADGAPRAASTPPRENRATPRTLLVDHRARPWSLGEPTGRPAALTFIYADCHATCPVLVATLRSTEALVGDGVDVLAVTLDPARDTPRALADYAARWQLGERWRLLTGAAGDLDRLRDAYQVRAVRQPDGEIAHENVIVLLDRRGRAAFTWRGLGQPPEDLARMLRALATERA